MDPLILPPPPAPRMDGRKSDGSWSCMRVRRGGKRSSHLVNVAKKGRREGRRISEYCPSERGKASIGVAKQQRGLPVHMRRCAGAALSLPLSACCCGLMAFRGPLFLFCTLESIKALSLSFCAGFDDLLQIGTRGERDRLSERLSKMVWP